MRRLKPSTLVLEPPPDSPNPFCSIIGVHSTWENIAQLKDEGVII